MSRSHRIVAWSVGTLGVAAALTGTAVVGMTGLLRFEPDDDLAPRRRPARFLVGRAPVV